MEKRYNIFVFCKNSKDNVELLELIWNFGNLVKYKIYR